MRCYFIRGGHIVAVEELLGFTEEEAVRKAKFYFLQHKIEHEGYEVWNRDRLVAKYTKPVEDAGDLRLVG